MMIPIVIGTEGGRGAKRGINLDQPNYNLFAIGQNTEKNPGYLSKLAVTQVPVKNHQLTLLWKTSKN